MCRMFVSVFPFCVHCVDKVKCPTEIGLGRTTPYRNWMIFVGDFVDDGRVALDTGGGGREKSLGRA